MLRGNGGELWLRGVRVARLAEWQMRPAGTSVSITATVQGRIAAIWLRPPLASKVRLRLTRSQTGYDLWFDGELVAIDPRQLTLHRCKECSNVSDPRSAAEGAGEPGGT